MVHDGGVRTEQQLDELADVLLEGGRVVERCQRIHPATHREGSGPQGLPCYNQRVL